MSSSAWLSLYLACAVLEMEMKQAELAVDFGKTVEQKKKNITAYFSFFMSVGWAEENELPLD